MVHPPWKFGLVTLWHLLKASFTQKMWCCHQWRTYKILTIVLHFLFCIKTKYSGSIKCTLQLISSNLLTFWLTTYLLCFSTNSRNVDMYQLCSSSDVLFYSYPCRLHTRVSQLKESSSIFYFHVPLYKWCPYRISQIELGVCHTLTYTSKLIVTTA